MTHTLTLVINRIIALLSRPTVPQGRSQRAIAVRTIFGGTEAGSDVRSTMLGALGQATQGPGVGQRETGDIIPKGGWDHCRGSERIRLGGHCHTFVDYLVHPWRSCHTHLRAHQDSVTVLSMLMSLYTNAHMGVVCCLASGRVYSIAHALDFNFTA